MKLIVTFLVISILFACNVNKKTSYKDIASNSNVAIAKHQEHPGKLLMENNCYMCHNPKTTSENRIAPSMVDVKLTYLTKDISKEDFINEIVAWTKEPSKEKTKMPDAVEKYGLMPYQFIPKSSIQKIADYLYDAKMK